MKTYNRIAVVICLITMHYPAHGWSILEIKNQLDSYKKTLGDVQKDVEKAKKQIEDTHKSIQEGVVNKLISAISDVEKQSKSLQGTIKELKKVPDFILQLVALGDLKTTLKWMDDNPVRTINETLVKVKDGFANVNKDIDPKTDPLKIYANFEKSEEDFARIVKKLNTTLILLNKLLE